MSSASEPLAKHYDYPIKMLPPPTEITDSRDVSVENVALGSRIKNYSGRTPEQQRRLYQVTLFAVATLIAAGLTLSAFMVPMMPLLYGAVPLFVIGMGAGIKRLIKQPDLDSEPERAKVREELATPGFLFSKLIAQYSIEDVVGYRLFDDIFQENPEDLKKNQLYFQLIALVTQYNAAKIQRDKDYKNATNQQRWQIETAFANTMNYAQQEYCKIKCWRFNPTPSASNTSIPPATDVPTARKTL